MRVELYDPAMCCSTGVCGPGIDPKLARVARDLEWLKGKGIKISRYNLAQDLKEFVENSTIQKLLNDVGADCLPVTLLDGKVMKQSTYPTTDELIKWTGVEGKPEGQIEVAAADSEIISIEGL